MAESARVVCLNVGGRLFATSSTTLKSAGQSFFTALLAGHLESARDDTGSYFIDRSPTHFEHILHFLRTGELTDFSSYVLEQLTKEADFYSLQKLKDALAAYKAEELRVEAAKGPLLQDLGCYVDDDNTSAYLFAQDGTLILVTGVQAFTQALVIHTHSKVPAEWKTEKVLEESYAIFYKAHIVKGKYTMNADGQGMVVVLPGGNATLKQHLATIASERKALCVTSFCCIHGTGHAQFGCSHQNPHHFHLYKFKHF